MLYVLGETSCKYVVNSFGGSTEGGASTGSGIDPITDDSETGDGCESTTTVNYPNGTTRKFRNYSSRKK